jgi:ABC-type antimicrobial peptide transport system permease subunit
MIQTLRTTVAQVDPLLALQDVQPMAAAIATVEAPRTFNTTLIAAFALGALLLSVVGIYAVVAFSVSLRSQEIAIRMALGAPRPAIARLILFSGFRMALLGCALGIIAALALSRFAASFLFGVSPTSPLLYATSTAIMILMALLASAIPALRAASSNPTEALRTT